MKFGIFYEHQLPRPWDVDSEYRLIQDALEQIEYADRIGIDYAGEPWTSRPWRFTIAPR